MSAITEVSYLQSILGTLNAADQMTQRVYSIATYLSVMRGEGPEQFTVQTAASVEQNLAELRRWLDRADAHFAAAREKAPNGRFKSGVSAGLAPKTGGLALTPKGMQAAAEAAQRGPVLRVDNGPGPVRAIPQTQPEHPDHPPCA